MLTDHMSRRAFSRLVSLGGATLVFQPSVGHAASAPQREKRASKHSGHKKLAWDFLTGMAGGDERRVLDRYCHPDCRFQIFHPFNTIDGLDAVHERFFATLRSAFPNYEQRIAFVVAGEYEERDMVSSWGHVMGTFDAPWLGIPPTNELTYLSFGFNAIVRDGKISKAYILLDIIDVLRQAGHYPLREAPGTTERWPFPPTDTGATALTHDPVRGAESLRIIREMQTALLTPAQYKAIGTGFPPQHPHWHENFNWYGPAGIGSMRGSRSYRNAHAQLFIQAFPDRSGFNRVKGGPEDAPGHYIRLGDGRFAVTTGYPSLRGTHTGSEWLGLPPTGRKIDLRVADWYRLDDNGKIYDNWVMMDIPHALNQMGLDIFHDLQFFVDRARLRQRLIP